MGDAMDRTIGRAACCALISIVHFMPVCILSFLHFQRPANENVEA